MTVERVGIVGAGQMGNGIAHVFALAIFIFLNFIGWSINNYLIGENKIYPFKARDWSFHGYVIFYTFILLLAIGSDLWN